MPTLSEADSKALLAEHGVPFPPERVVATAEAAVEAADAIGYPAVVKLGGEGIAHKTERGLVRLGLGTAEQVRGRRGAARRGGPRTARFTCWSPPCCGRPGADRRLHHDPSSA